MEMIDAMPEAKNGRRGKWDETADLLRQGKVLRFNKGIDFDADAATFRVNIYAAMKSRGITIRSVRDGDDLCVTQKQ